MVVGLKFVLFKESLSELGLFSLERSRKRRRRDLIEVFKFLIDFASPKVMDLLRVHTDFALTETISDCGKTQGWHKTTFLLILGDYLL